MESTTVRFFNTQRGFGKLNAIAATDGSDIYFHRSDFQANSDPVEGELVEFELEKNSQGFKARNVTRVATRLEGKVTAFASGHGRITPDGQEGSIFVHHSDIVGSGYRTLELGERVGFEIISADRGPKAVRVTRLETRAPLERFAVLDQWATKIGVLADPLAHKEDWDYRHTPSKHQLPILHSYLHHTFKRLEEENKILQSKDRAGADIACFNTGLATEKQEEIFAFFTKNQHATEDGRMQKWVLQGFFAESDRRFTHFANRPETANYFSDPSELLYDSRLRLQLDIPHIVEENRDRFPGALQSNEYTLRGALDWAIESAKKRVRRNYKAAIPQFHRGRLQLLLPLCLLAPERADLALVVAREQEVYRGSTVLTLDMAYNNARLIARPDTEWLSP